MQAWHLRGLSLRLFKFTGQWRSQTRVGQRPAVGKGQPLSKSRPVVGAGSPAQNGPLLQQPGLPGASAARQGNKTDFLTAIRHFSHRGSTTLFRRSNMPYNTGVTEARLRLARPCAHAHLKALFSVRAARSARPASFTGPSQDRTRSLD